MQDEIFDIIKKRDLEKLKLWFEQGGKVDVKNTEGKTPLALAALLGNVEILTLLLKNGAMADIENANVALHQAASYGRLNSVEFLLKNGAQINSKDESGWTAFHYAAESGCPQSLEIIKYLLENGADGLAKTEGDLTALHFASMNHRVRDVKYLLEKGLKVDDKDAEGNTPVHFGARLGSSQVFEYLLQYSGLDLINAQNKNGETVLSLSANYYAKFLLCLKKGAYVDLLLNNGKSIYESLPNEYSFKDARICLKATEELLRLAGSGSNLKLLREQLDILKFGLNGRQVKTGNTALHIAILNKQTDAVKALLEHGADVLMTNHEGKTALSLLQKLYAKEAFLLASAYTRALTQLEETLSFQKEYGLLLKGSELIKKTGKERAETASFNNTMTIEALSEEYLDELELCMKNIPEEQRNKLCLSLGELLSNPYHCLFLPLRAYQFLSLIGEEPTVSNADFFLEAQKMMLNLLVTQPEMLEKERRLFCIIKHSLNSKNEYDGTLMKFISDYVHGDKPVESKMTQDTSVQNQLTIIKEYRAQAEILMKRKKELQEKRDRLKALELQKKRLQGAGT